MVILLGKKLAALSFPTEPLFRYFFAYVAYEVIDDSYLLPFLAIDLLSLADDDFFNKRCRDFRGQLSYVSKLPYQFYKAVCAVRRFLVLGDGYAKLFTTGADLRLFRFKTDEHFSKPLLAEVSNHLVLVQAVYDAVNFI